MDLKKIIIAVFLTATFIENARTFEQMDRPLSRLPKGTELKQLEDLTFYAGVTSFDFGELEGTADYGEKKTKFWLSCKLKVGFAEFDRTYPQNPDKPLLLAYPVTGQFNQVRTGRNHVGRFRKYYDIKINNRQGMSSFDCNIVCFYPIQTRPTVEDFQELIQDYFELSLPEPVSIN